MLRLPSPRRAVRTTASGGGPAGGAGADGAIVGPQRGEKLQGRCEEEAAGNGVGEVQQAIVGAGRPADDHVFQHQLHRARRAGVADEVGARVAAARAAERHVVAADRDLLTVLFDHRQGVVRVGRLDVVLKLDVVQLPAADDPFLDLRCQAVPGGVIVDVLLDHDVAAAGERLVLVADDRRRDARLAVRVLGAVHEAGQIAEVEIAEAVRLVDQRRRCRQAGRRSAPQARSRSPGRRRSRGRTGRRASPGRCVGRTETHGTGGARPAAPSRTGDPRRRTRRRQPGRGRRLARAPRPPVAARPGYCKPGARARLSRPGLDAVDQEDGVAGLGQVDRRLRLGHRRRHLVTGHR